MDSCPVHSQMGIWHEAHSFVGLPPAKNANPVLGFLTNTFSKHEKHINRASLLQAQLCTLLTVLFSLLATCTTSGGPAEEAVLKYGEGLIRICRTGVSLTSPELSHRAQPLPSAANRRAHPTNTGNTFISFLTLKAYLLVHTSSIDLQMPALSCECLMVRGFGGEYPSLYPSSSISFPLSPALFPFPPSYCGSFISDFIFWGFKSRFYTVNDRFF